MKTDSGASVCCVVANSQLQPPLFFQARSGNTVDIFNGWPWVFARGNAVKISSMMGTMNMTNRRGVPTVRLNTGLHFLRLAFYPQVRCGEKCRTVVLSSGILTSVPGCQKPVEPSDFGVALT
jgi:hypothetical protein